MKLFPFSSDAKECPKCGWGDQTTKFRSGDEEFPKEEFGEHLELTCMVCSYKFAMRCKNAPNAEDAA